MSLKFLKKYSYSQIGFVFYFNNFPFITSGNDIYGSTHFNFIIQINILFLYFFQSLFFLHFCCLLHAFYFNFKKTLFSWKNCYVRLVISFGAFVLNLRLYDQRQCHHRKQHPSQHYSEDRNSVPCFQSCLHLVVVVVFLVQMIITTKRIQICRKAIDMTHSKMDRFGFKVYLLFYFLSNIVYF